MRMSTERFMQQLDDSHINASSAPLSAIEGIFPFSVLHCVSLPLLNTSMKEPLNPRIRIQKMNVLQ